LAIDVAGDGHDRNDEESVSGQEVAERKTEKPACIQLLGVERQDDDNREKWDEAREHLPFGVAPIRFALFAFDHLLARFSIVQGCRVRSQSLANLCPAWMGFVQL